MNKLIEDNDVTIVTTDDDDDDTATHIDPVETSYPSDEEFDPYESGLNDFTFEDSIDDNEVI